MIEQLSGLSGNIWLISSIQYEQGQPICTQIDNCIQNNYKKLAESKPNPESLDTVLEVDGS